MDFGDLILLLILLAPLLNRLFGKKQKPGRRPQRSPDAESIGSPAEVGQDPLAEALRQIREALAEPEPEPVRTTAPSLPEHSRPPLPAKEPGFHGLGAFEHDEHGFGRSNPISEEVFERQGPSSRLTKRPPPIKQKSLQKVDLSTPIEVKEIETSSRPDYSRLLKNPARIREAFILKEVFDPPRSLQSRR